MIYAPKRFVFIHIPRTGGNSVTSAVAASCAGRNIDLVIGTLPPIKSYNRFNRHVRAMGLKRFIPEWDDIYKFAVYRNEADRIESSAGLVRMDLANKVYEDETCSEGWRELLTGDNPEQTMRDRVARTPCDHYTRDVDGSELGIEMWDFVSLSDDWEEICKRCKIPYSPLPHLGSSKGF